MNHKEMENLKKNYINTPIPKELDIMVEKILIERRMKMTRQRNIKRVLIPLASLAAAFTVMVVGINISPSMATSLGEMPIVGNVLKVLTFREYNIDEDGYNGNIVTPGIEGLEDEELQNSLNQRYIEENKILYDNFVEEIEELKQNGGGT